MRVECAIAQQIIEHVQVASTRLQQICAKRRVLICPMQLDHREPAATVQRSISATGETSGQGQYLDRVNELPQGSLSDAITTHVKSSQRPVALCNTHGFSGSRATYAGTGR